MGLEPVPKKVKFDLDPLLDSLTPSERLKEGAQLFTMMKTHLRYGFVFNESGCTLKPYLWQIGCLQACKLTSWGILQLSSQQNMI